MSCTRGYFSRRDLTYEAGVALSIRSVFQGRPRLSEFVRCGAGRRESVVTTSLQ